MSQYPRTGLTRSVLLSHLYHHQLALSFVFALTARNSRRLAIFDEVDAALDEVCALPSLRSHTYAKNNEYFLLAIHIFVFIFIYIYCVYSKSATKIW